MARCLEPHSCLASAAPAATASEPAGQLRLSQEHNAAFMEEWGKMCFNPRAFDCKSNRATTSTLASGTNWMNNRKQSERCVTDFYIRLLPLRHKHMEAAFCQNHTHTQKSSLCQDVPPPPPPLVLWVVGQAEVTQVALLRFHLLGCERDRDPDQTRPD